MTDRRTKKWISCWSTKPTNRRTVGLYREAILSNEAKEEEKRKIIMELGGVCRGEEKVASGREGGEGERRGWY